MVRQYIQKLEENTSSSKISVIFFVLQLLVRGEEELHDLHGTLIGDGEFADRCGHPGPRLTVARQRDLLGSSLFSQ